MAAGLPKTRLRGAASVPPPLPGVNRGVRASVLVRASSWQPGVWCFLCSISLLSLSSFAVSPQLDSSPSPMSRDFRGSPTSPLVAAPGTPPPSTARPRTPAALAPRAASGVNIVCLGDSLTQGVGASRGHDYPSLLSQTMGTAVINAGVDGDETGDALKRLESDVLAKNPRLVIVELGANDFLDGQPLAQTFENLEEIVRRIEARGALVVLVGLAPGPLGAALQPRYDTFIHKYHVAFVPKVLEGILTNPALKSDDHLHPNDQGYALITERIQHVVALLLSQKP